MIVCFHIRVQFIFCAVVLECILEAECVAEVLISQNDSHVFGVKGLVPLKWFSVSVLLYLDHNSQHLIEKHHTV